MPNAMNMMMFDAERDEYDDEYDEYDEDDDAYADEYDEYDALSCRTR